MSVYLIKQFNIHINDKQLPPFIIFIYAGHFIFHLPNLFVSLREKKCNRFFDLSCDCECNYKINITLKRKK